MTEKNKISVFYILGTLGAGGTERNVLNIVKTIDKGQFDVHVFSGQGGPLEKEFYDVRNIKLYFHQFKRPVFPKMVLRLIKILHHTPVDIIHSMNYPVNFIGTIAAILTNIPVRIIAIQEKGIWKHFPDFIMDRLIYPYITLAIADGEGSRKSYLRSVRKRHKSITIYDGADVKISSAKDNISNIIDRIDIDIRKKIIGVVARLDEPIKGVGDFIKAAKIIRQKYPSIQFLIVGTGKDDYKLKQLACDLRINEDVIFAGYKRIDIGTIMSLMDVLVIPSRSESVPKVLIEAMSVGKPVVATDAGDISEIMKHGETGLLVPVGNHHLIADAVLHLLKDENKANELGVNARNDILLRGLTLSRSTNKLEDIYKKLLKTQIGSRLSMRIPWFLKFFLLVILLSYPYLRKFYSSKINKRLSNKNEYLIF